MREGGREGGQGRRKVKNTCVCVFVHQPDLSTLTISP